MNQLYKLYISILEIEGDLARFACYVREQDKHYVNKQNDIAESCLKIYPCFKGIYAVKCGTSVGANYCEADDAESKSDFKHKIGICKKEARESKHFIRMLVIILPDMKDEAAILWREAKEINLIFNTIYRKVS